jgi:hypothetical protein
LSGAEKREILGLIGGSRQDVVFGGAMAAVFSGLVPRRRSIRQINPIAVTGCQAQPDSHGGSSDEESVNRSNADMS